MDSTIGNYDQMEALLSTIGLDLEIGALSPGGGAPEVQEKRSLFSSKECPGNYIIPNRAHISFIVVGPSFVVVFV